MRGTPQELQRRYYAETAGAYDRMHEADEAEQLVALRYMCALMDVVDIGSIVDVGAGTGRTIRHLSVHRPSVRVLSVEPVPELLRDVARTLRSPTAGFLCAGGESLPLGDESVDAACAFAVLHHVPDPDRVVREMTRVARKAIFLSDANRFAQGPLPARWLKLGLWKTGLWPFVFWLRTGARGYIVSEGDGISYSYSVYDSYERLAAWADRIVIIPTGAGAGGWFGPLFTSRHVLLGALRER